MSSTSSPTPPSAGHGETVRTVTAAGRTLRVSVRPGTDPALPALLLMNGIGASLEVLQPFVDALDRRRTVIRFDVPGAAASSSSSPIRDVGAGISSPERLPNHSR